MKKIRLTVLVDAEVSDEIEITNLYFDSSSQKIRDTSMKDVQADIISEVTIFVEELT